MKKFIGTKEVKAEPCCLGDFIQLSGRNPYANDGKMHDNNEPGYIVEYEDGYKSWSPKEVFEKAYKCSEAFIDRLHIELEEVSERQSKLNGYFDTEHFANLPIEQRNLLKAQFGAMLAYSQILVERIRLVSPPCGCVCEGCNTCAENVAE